MAIRLSFEGWDSSKCSSPSIAKTEKRTDRYLSSLRSRIEAMGGELKIIARFTDGSVKASNVADLGNAAACDVNLPHDVCKAAGCIRWWPA